MRQEDEAGGPQDTGKAQEPEGSAEKAGSKKDKYQKAQAKAEHAGGKLGKAREKLDKTEAKRAAKKPPGLAKKAVRGARTEAWFYVHNKIHEVEHTRLANKMAGISKRDEATVMQLNNLSLMENIILHEIDMGIMKGKHYKEIYKDCKERLETVKDLAYLEAV